MLCGQAVDASAAMPGIVALGPHAIIMDLTLEDGSVLDVIERITSRSPQTAVPRAVHPHRTPLCGSIAPRRARGYISKTEPTQKIIAALRRVLQGKVYLSPAALQCLIGERAAQMVAQPSLVAAGPPSIETLSDRELEVFAMTGRGLGTRHIAALLHLSPKTIQAYHGRIKVKLQLCDANELIREAIGWTETDGKRNRRTSRQPDND